MSGKYAQRASGNQITLKINGVKFLSTWHLPVNLNLTAPVSQYPLSLLRVLFYQIIKDPPYARSPIFLTRRQIMIQVRAGTFFSVPIFRGLAIESFVVK